jgi:hypothetical protein
MLKMEFRVYLFSNDDVTVYVINMRWSALVPIADAVHGILCLQVLRNSQVETHIQPRSVPNESKGTNSSLDRNLF